MRTSGAGGVVPLVFDLHCHSGQERDYQWACILLPQSRFLALMSISALPADLYFAVYDRARQPSSRRPPPRMKSPPMQ